MPDFENRIKALLSYDPETGLFTWLVTTGKAIAGSVAGTENDQGYIIIGIEGRRYRANRLAWFFMKGKMPERSNDVDHENRNRSDNRWDNLRDATRTQNNQNAKVRTNNRSGIRGVSWHGQNKKWDARIRVDGKTVLLGTHDCIAKASKARVDAEKEHYGEFAGRKTE